MHVVRRIFSLIFIGFLLVAVTPSAKTEENTLRRVVLLIPTQLDPHLFTTSLQRVILNDLFVGLTRINTDGEIEPAIAERWTISDDQKTYTFYLKKHIEWNDGVKITANDFVQSFSRLQALGRKSTQATLYKDIKGFRFSSSENKKHGVTALDAHTLQIELTKPFPFLLHALTRPAAFPIANHTFSEHGNNWAHQISNGPYVLDSITENEHIILKKNPNYFEHDQVHIEQVKYVKLDNLNTGVRIVTSGNADISHSLDERQLAAAKAAPGFNLNSRNTMSLIFLHLNPQDSNLQDIQIRKALYLATDTPMFLKANNLNYSPIDGLIPMMKGFTSTIRKTASYEERLRAAQKLMQSAGYSERNRLTLTLQSGNYVQNNVPIAIQRQWRNIYIDLQLKILPYAKLKQHLNEGNFQVMRRGWRFSYPDPTGFLRIYTHEYNMKLYPEFDPVLIKYFSDINADLTHKTELINAAEQYMMNQYPAVPLYTKPENILVSNKVEGWVTSLGISNQSRWLKLKH